MGLDAGFSFQKKMCAEVERLGPTAYKQVGRHG